MPLDSAQVFSVLDRITDASGAIVPNGTVAFYEAGTLTPKTVYADAELSVVLGTSVSSDSGGYPVTGGGVKTLIYTGTDDYKIIVKDAAGTTLLTHDNVKGAAVTPTATTMASPVTPVVSKVLNETILLTDRAKLMNVNPTGSPLAMTLPSAVTAGDGFRVGFRHVGTANTVAIVALTGQTISHSGKASQSFPLVSYGESVWLASDGGNWHVDSYTPPFMTANLAFFRASGRLVNPPLSPTAGARYIINGTPTGVWATLGFADKDIAEADGNGSWTLYAPADGYLAYVENENLLIQYRDTTWTELSNITPPSASALATATFSDVKAQNTAGGVPTAGAWTKRTINTSVQNSITGASIASDQITLPTGNYLVVAHGSYFATDATGQRFISTTTPAKVLYAPQQYFRYYNATTDNDSDYNGGTLVSTGMVSVTAASETFELQYHAASASGGSNGLGTAKNIASTSEQYTHVTIVKIDALQGPQGVPGIAGADGLDSAYPYAWSTSTSGDPGSGKIAGNNATPALITQIQVSETDSAGGAMAAALALWDDSTNPNRATVIVRREVAASNFHVFRVTGAGTDQGTYWTFPVTFVGTSGTLSNGDACAVDVSIAGNKGDVGASGSSVYPFDWTWDTGTTDADPGAGKLRANHANLTSATQLFINETDRLGVLQAAAIQQWDDSTTSTVKGYLTLIDIATPINRARFSITGAITDAGGYDKVPVSYVTGSTSLSAVNVAVLFERTGDTGDIGGPTPVATTPAPETSSTRIATTAFVSRDGELSGDSVIGSSGARLLAAHAILYRAYGYNTGTFSSPVTARMAILGDSVANSLASVWASDLHKRMNGSSLTATPVAPNQGGTVAGSKLAPLTGTAPLISNAYAYGFSGQYYDLASGADTTWGASGANPIFQTGKIYFVKEPGAGTLSVDIGGVFFTSQSASAGSISLGIINLTNAATTNTVLRLYTSGGPVKILYVPTCRTTENGVYYLDLALGGLSLGLALSQTTGVNLLKAILADFSPHILMYEMKEVTEYTVDGFPGVTFDQRFGELSDAIDASCPRPCDIVMVSSHAYVQRASYDDNQQAASSANRVTMRKTCIQRDYIYYDSYGAMGEQTVLQDAIHGAVSTFVAQFRGAYDALTTYTLGDVAYHGGTGYRYINASPSAGNAAPNATYWTLWGAAYSAGTTYRQHDVVTSGIYWWSYINATPGAGNAPPTAPAVSNSYWQMVDGYSLDGTHPSRLADAYRTGVLNALLGISGNPHSYLPGPINETVAPSRLAHGSKFSLGKVGQELEVYALNPTGIAYEWGIKTPVDFVITESTTGNQMIRASRYGNPLVTGLLQYATWLNGAICLDAWQGDAIFRANTVATKAKSLEAWHRTDNVRGNFAARVIEQTLLTVATLPAAASCAGCSAWVSDATVAFTTANVGTVVVGGGANKAPVKCNGTDWRIG